MTTKIGASIPRKSCRSFDKSNPFPNSFYIPSFPDLTSYLNSSPESQCCNDCTGPDGCGCAAVAVTVEADEVLVAAVVSTLLPGYEIAIATCIIFKIVDS